jgi:DNA invertase Pin-like site-specific DNA recombinase
VIQKLDDETIERIKETYKKTGSISETARALNLPKGVVGKYLNEQMSSREGRHPSYPSKNRVQIKTVHVNIHDVICE